MILGIGTDIVRVARMERILKRFGARFARRILTPNELRDFERAARPAHFLAKRFAAKEAAAKAFGTGFRDGLLPRHIGVVHDEFGRPCLEFIGPASLARDRLGPAADHVSIADECEYAVAFVTLSRMDH
ncbi:MAG: holo-ACP synthase [Gammaproteobacteria bacterium]